MTNLPNSNQIDVGKLIRIFDDTTNSYKFLFFQAILEILYDEQFLTSKINQQSIAARMLANAWFPHEYYHLSFGKIDQIGSYLDKLPKTFERPVAKKEILELVVKNVNFSNLLNYVPYRLISVFFEDELRRKKDGLKNKIITELSNIKFQETKPLYRIVNDDFIEIHDDWMVYIKNNFGIIKHWMLWNWQEYLQNRNPNVPAISKKLFPPQKRISLTKETKYWKTIMNQSNLYCIYSGDKLNKNKISLDHFLPWSFVAHNQLWNLVPVSKSINSIKSNNLPSWNHYKNALVEIQLKGLQISKELMTEKSWANRTESFIADLKIKDQDELLKKKSLEDGYNAVIPPLIQLAKNVGFSDEWGLFP